MRVLAPAHERTGLVFDAPRLVLRPFNSADADALFRVLGNPEVMHFSAGGAHQSAADTFRWIEHAIRHRAIHRFAKCAILSRRGDDIIGTCGLEVLPDGRIEIGYRVRRDKQRQGYAIEAARAWLDYGFSTLGLSRVVAIIEEANHRSVRVAEKIGMQAGAPEIFHGVHVIAYFAEAERYPCGRCAERFHSLNQETALRPSEFGPRRLAIKIA